MRFTWHSLQHRYCCVCVCVSVCICLSAVGVWVCVCVYLIVRGRGMGVLQCISIHKFGHFEETVCMTIYIAFQSRGTAHTTHLRRETAKTRRGKLTSLVTQSWFHFKRAHKYKCTVFPQKPLSPVQIANGQSLLPEGSPSTFNQHLPFISIFQFLLKHIITLFLKNYKQI